VISIILAGKLAVGQLVAMAIDHYFGGKLPVTQQLARGKRKSCRNLAIEEQNIKYQFNREHVSKIMNFDIL